MVTQKFMVDNQIITLKDNLFHPYFSSISVAKDNLSPVGICKMEMPYMQEALDYWMKYDGAVVISFSVEETNTEEYLKTLQSNNKTKNNEYNYSFIGKIHKVKHRGNKVTIYLEDIGWKFEQKVPNDFRKMYIAGRYLDDAFQAICEFLDVRFCYSIEHLHQYTFGDDGYSVQKDGQTIEEVQNTYELVSEETLDALDDPLYEDVSLFDYIKNKKELEEKRKKAEEKKQQENQNLDNNQQNNNNQDQNNNDQNNIENQQNDNQDIIPKLLKYKKDFEQKIQDLFVGNKYYDSNLTSIALNYGGITLEPQNPQDNSSLNEVSNENNENNNGDNNNGAKYTDNNGKRTQEIRNALEMKSKKKQVLDTKTYQKINQLNQNNPVGQSTSTTQQNPAFYRTFYKPKITVQK